MRGKQPVAPLGTAQLTPAQDNNNQDKYHGVQHEAGDPARHGPDQAEEDYNNAVDLEEGHSLDLGNLEYRCILRQVDERGNGGGANEEAIGGKKHSLDCFQFLDEREERAFFSSLARLARRDKIQYTIRWAEKDGESYLN